MIVLLTEREGTVVVWTATGAEPRQRALIDIEGVDLSHPELVEFGLDLSRRFGWNGREIQTPAKAIRRAQALPPASSPPSHPVKAKRKPGRPAGSGKPVRSAEEAQAFREEILLDIEAHPGTTIKVLGERLDEPGANLSIYCKQLLSSGQARREGTGTSRDPYRWHSTRTT